MKAIHQLFEPYFDRKLWRAALGALIATATCAVHQAKASVMCGMTSLVCSDPVAGENAGTAIACWNDEVFMGVPGKNTTSGMDAGAVYMFRISNGTWSQSQFISPSSLNQFDNFGCA